MITATGPGAAREWMYASTTDTFDEALDLDYVAIELALNGEPVTLTIAEKVYAARILDERGFSGHAIAARVNAARETVVGWKANGWKPGPARPKRKERVPPQCGEPRMYRLHLRRGESCDECRAANAAADRRYRLTGTRKKAA